MKKYLFITALLFGFSTAKAQLFIDNGYTAQEMINAFFDNPLISISNVTYTGAPVSLGFFEGSNSNIGLNAGLLVTTGDAQLAVGPNNLESAGAQVGVPGSAWMDALIPGYTTYDASIIEMDITSQSDTLLFKYVFASEEYKEFVNSQFNDVFAFFIEGPGYALGDSIYVPADTIVHYDSCFICVDTFLVQMDTFFCYFDSIQQIDTCIWLNDTLYQWCYFDNNCPGDTVVYPAYWYNSPGGTNLAQIPNTNLPVTINTLNQFLNSQYFIDNAGGATVQYDAFTTVLTARAQVVPMETYHIRIAIADAGDGVYDSGVFLSIESLGGDSLLIVDPEFLVMPGGGSNTFTFDNQTMWATQWHWDFGDGTTSEERYPEHTFAADGNYTVMLTASNWCSQKSYMQQVQVGVSSVNEPVGNIFRVMPNPTSGSFLLDLQKDDAAQVRLSSTDGRLLMDGVVNDGTRIDLNQFGKGMFVLQVISGGKVYTERVVNR